MEFCQTHLHQVRSAKAGLGAPCSARHRSSRITTTLVENTLTADLRAHQNALSVLINLGIVNSSILTSSHNDQ